MDVWHEAQRSAVILAAIENPAAETADEQEPELAQAS
jgi:hypothetical protein